MYRQFSLQRAAFYLFLAGPFFNCRPLQNGFMFSAPFRKELGVTIKLAFPIVIAQLGVVLMGVTDNIMVGRLLGKTALGVSGIANSIAYLISSIAVGGVAVIAPMISKARAENNAALAGRLFKASLTVATGLSILLTIPGVICYFFFEYFGQPAVINNLAPEFLLYILLSNIPLYFFMSAKQFTDGLSKPFVAMSITLLGLIINIAANYLLITGAFGFPELGVKGAAVATLFSRFLMAVLLIFYIRFSGKFSHYFLPSANENDYRLVWNISKLCIPGGFQFFFEIGAFSFAIIMMGWISETALAAHQIAINIATTTYMMASGIAFAGGIRVGEAWGLRSPRKIRISGYAAYLLVFSFMTLSMITIYTLKEQLLSLYISDEDVLSIAIPLLVIASVFQLSDGLQVVGLGVLRGLADVRIPTFITFIAYWIIALPAGYILGFIFGWQSYGIWTGLLSGLSVSAILLYFRFFQLTRPSKLKSRLGN